MACRSCHHQRLKPHSFHGSARLKPCPDTNQIITSCSRKCRNSRRRLKAGGSQDWLPHRQVHTRYSACRRPLARIAHICPSEVAHALVGAVSRLTLLDTLVGYGQSVGTGRRRSEEHTSELQSLRHLVCRL